MKRIKMISIWAAPVLLALVGIFQLFFDNYLEVTEPPSDGWSRNLQLAETEATDSFSIQKNEDGSMTVAHLDQKGIVTTTYDSDTFEVVNESRYDIPVTKFTDFYIHGENTIFSDYYSIYHAGTKEKLTDIQQFFPLKDDVFYKKDGILYQLDLDTMSSAEVMTIDHEQIKLQVEQIGSEVFALTNRVDQQGNHLTLFKQSEQGMERVSESLLTVKPSEEVSDIQFTVMDQTYGLLVKTAQKQSMSGKVVFSYYYSTTPFGQEPELTPVTFDDPAGKGQLTELSDFQLVPSGEKLTLLFRAFGATETRLGETHQFNIYEASLEQSNGPMVTRLSNTANSSFSPVWVDPTTVAWMDQASGDKKKIQLASTDPTVIQKADRLTTDVFLQALGKTMGMLASSLFAVMISTFWFIWPILFVAGVMMVNGRAMDQDRKWVFYTGAGIYLLAAILFRDRLMTDMVLAQIPSYLNLPGHGFVSILLFAAVIFGILMYGTSIRKWSSSVKLTYFIGIHVMCMALFFGPYLL